MAQVLFITPEINFGKQVSNSRFDPDISLKNVHLMQSCINRFRLD